MDALKFTSLLSIRYSVVMRLDSTVACCQTTHWLLPLRRRKLSKDTINACTNAGSQIKLPLQATGKVKRSWFFRGTKMDLSSVEYCGQKSWLETTAWCDLLWLYGIWGYHVCIPVYRNVWKSTIGKSLALDIYSFVCTKCESLTSPMLKYGSTVFLCRAHWFACADAK